MDLSAIRPLINTDDNENTASQVLTCRPGGKRKPLIGQ